MTQEVLAPGITGLTRTDVESVSARRDEPAWLREQRAAAWQRYVEMDFPDAYDEEWRRTDVRAMTFDGMKPLSASAAVSAADALPASIRSAWDDDAVAGRIFQHDSDVVFTQLSDDLRAKGVILTDLHTAAREHGELLQKYLSQAVKAGEWKYLALNAALWSGGCFLFVPKGVEIDLPVQLSTGVSTEGLALFPHTVIVAERQSKVTFIDEATSPDHDKRSFVSGAVEIYVGDGAHVAYYSVNRWGRNTYNFNTVRAMVGRDAQFLAMTAGIGSTMTKMRIDTEMTQSGSRVDLLGVTFGDGDQHFDYNTLQDHAAPHTSSDLQFKSALAGSASLAWYGITRIKPQAGGSDANQTSRNLLLSEHAKASPIPILEIEAHDVSKCSHGATAGPVDENELFYLEARAIPREIAEHMLVEGFFTDVIDRIPNVRLRERVLDAVLAKAGGRAGTSLSFDEVLSA
ncbi:MAG: Fe-S cluster assembly protein SufD [Chloroflexi bacterium]|nr:Fe-S cluster assembly protein SufD [Chloroflexota bacterium]